MKIRFKAAVGLAAFAAIALAPGAAAADCGQPEQDAVYDTVVIKATPAVYAPDVLVIDVPAKPAVPGTPAVEEVSHIEKVLVTPAIPGTPEQSHIEKVLVTEAYDEVIIDSPAVPGQHYSLKGSSKLEKDEVPETPEVNPDIWQANTEQEPHDNGNGNPVTWYDVEGSGLHFASHGQYGEGNRDWFYFRSPVAEVSHVVHHDAVYEDVKVIDVEATPGTPAVYEDVKVIDVEAKPAVPGTDAVPEVSHLEKGALITPATPGSTKTVLISEAVPATDVCIVPASSTTPSSARLAQTGTDIPLIGGVGLALLAAGGVIVYAMRRRSITE